MTLAQRKPVIVYVARLFERLPALRQVYEAIDKGARIERDLFADHLVVQGLIEAEEKNQLLGPEKTKADVVRALIEKHGRAALKSLEDHVIALELIRRGYDPERSGSQLLELTLDKMQRLERRALTFRDVHPLSLQTSPIDGVARGVIVTRTVEATAEVVNAIFLGTLKYEIVDVKLNWLLVDGITNSPIRVVTKDSILTTAFWNENWGTVEEV